MSTLTIFLEPLQEPLVVVPGVSGSGGPKAAAPPVLGHAPPWVAALQGRSPRHAARWRPRSKGQLHNAVKRYVFRASAFNQMGLYYDDCLYENEDVQEALRRLPQPVMDDRNFRMQRALHLSLTKKILPKEEWPSYEEDREKGRYLQSYLDEVIREKREREEWNKK
ncbi:Cytochrome b-c1 complex subunit 7 [Chionoecetes opilio]|uniref:Cytochrome b-c1 complex subunit 7 n=1 Tax=Chionoecetes opilio TaxID=41210 RepID=A0A8J5CXG7_CHIOP|nr:Cytochrome b-c1 complex subunit 7 [Chionoecetes opilio]